jgi:hypothetical protein
VTSGSSTGSGDSDAGSSDDTGAPLTTDGSTTTAAAYPSGQECAAAGTNGHLKVGCIPKNTTWIGYDDESGSALATASPYASFSLADVYADAQKSGKKYAMLNVAEFDCPGCQNSATELGATTNGVTAGAAVIMAGGVVIEVLETSGFVDVASQANLEAWVSKYSLHVTAVEDPGYTATNPPASPTLAYFGHRDQAYIIDLTTMKILEYCPGSELPQAENSAGQAMEAMQILLGVSGAPKTDPCSTTD